MKETIILDWNKYIECAVKVVEEGCVLLKNDNGCLPIKRGSAISVFGRIGLHYYKSGTGSGGMVNVSKVTGIIDGLAESGYVTLNTRLLEVYKKWDEKNPFDEGCGWGNEPWSQAEMPVSDELVAEAEAASDCAVVIIGRTAGEDKDNSDTRGAFRLSEIEEDMLVKVRKHFAKMIVVLNVGGIFDMSFIDSIKPDSVLLAWQGGMTGGTGTANILVGKACPSGKLTDSIAYKLSDYPSDKYFGGSERNFYTEDIYVGYRYFETFAADKVRFPFGFGLSYTGFDVKTVSTVKNGDLISVEVKVRNTGSVFGKEVVQLYAEAPQGKLGKPLRSLCAFEKTTELAPNEEQLLHFELDVKKLASYDDSGVTGYKSCFVLESGEYKLYIGTNVRNAAPVFAFEIDKLTVCERLSEALAPVMPFDRFKPQQNADSTYSVSFEAVPICTIDMEDRRNAENPAEIGFSGDKGIKLQNVLSGENTMDEFISQLTDDDLTCIIRGEGMGSPKVTAGTAAAFGGVSPSLVKLGVPTMCCDDGPSGMRLDSGAKAFSLPNGTLCACTYNPKLLEQLFTFTGLEMTENKVECLLGPGINIHRHALNGRNFEYFSEDPYLTGKMACAVLDGLHSAGLTGTIKHFAGNNQEWKRREIDSIISERALREIYLKAFEMAVKESGADSIMTTYGSLNGLWTSGSYDLNTTILRNQWGFKGIVMSDWWAMINRRGEKPSFTDFAAMAASQNDLYMVCPDGARNASGDNTAEALADGRITRGELERCARNICTFALHTRAMERLLGAAPTVEIINRPADSSNEDFKDIEFIDYGTSMSFALDTKKSDSGTNYIFGVELNEPGRYRVTVTGLSELSELAQIPCTLFYCGIPFGVFTFNGTAGADKSHERLAFFDKKYSIIRLFVAKNGVQLKSLKLELVDKLEDVQISERNYY